MIMVSVCLPSDAFSQHLLSHLGLEELSQVEGSGRAAVRSYPTAEVGAAAEGNERGYPMSKVRSSSRALLEQL